jgi:two-component system, chemotaxis family, CheB/CheR fusion protein
MPRKVAESNRPTLIVGVGASAGGLEALKALFNAIPAPGGIAVVVVQHFDPHHESHLAELLSTHTTMKVRAAKDGLSIEPGCAYTNPSDRYLLCRDGVLRFAEPIKDHGLRMPIDCFFRSLAEDQKERAAGVILSGSGSDGTLGTRAIRSSGGLTIAQFPQEAQFASMPEHAIATGMVDLVLPIADIPAKLFAFSQRSTLLVAENGEETAEEPSEALERIISFLYERGGFDFRSYKRGTIRRRVERRMGLSQASSMVDYLHRLGKDAAEADALVKDLMIGVTQFFRDPAAFEGLRAKAVLSLMAEREAGAPIRAWVPGCSTGEEAYSIAMLIAESAPLGSGAPPAQVFATDVDKKALAIAREGVYPASIAADVSAERLERFFTLQGDSYRAKRELRECIVFAAHNLLVDAPFSHLDLVSCRNVLIYFSPEAQRKILSLFSLSLTPGSYLFLGSSDSATHEESFFAEISRKHGLYRRTMALTKPTAMYAGRASVKLDLAGAGRQTIDFSTLNQRALAKRFSACIILAESSGQILQVQGPASKYLQFPTGRPTLNLFSLAPDPIGIKLRTAVESALATGTDIDIPRVTAITGTSRQSAHVTVMPMVDEKTNARLVAVIFADAAPSAHRAKRGPVSAEEASETAQLRDELKTTREDLQAVIRRMEGANEDLTAANEKVTSMNEELQSTVEELGTAQEEGLSVNEELITVNAELRERADQLRVAHDDLANLFNTTTSVTLLLDRALRLRRFTTNATAVFHLSALDVGRPLSQITGILETRSLEINAQEVLRDLRPVESEVEAPDGSWYTLRILPYRTLDDRVDGVVLNLTDVSRLKRAEEFAESVIATVREPLLVVDEDLRVVSVNAALCRFFDVRPEEAQGRRVFDLGARGWASPALHRAFADVIPHDSEIRDFPVTGMLAGPVPRTVLLNARRIEGEPGRPGLILVIFEEITEKLRAEEVRRVAGLQITEAEARERKHFSQILHDQIQQFIVAAKMWIGDALGHATGPDLSTALRTAENNLEQALQVSRSLTSELSPPVLFAGGLVRALEWLRHLMQENYGLSLALNLDPAAEPEGDLVRTFLFWSIKELLFNVVKHSGVKEARLALSRVGEQILVEVNDSGKGIDDARKEAIDGGTAGYGLASIRERLTMLGGQMELQARPGAGTTAILRISAAVGVGDHPTAAHDPQTMRDRATPVPAGASASIGASGIRVLLVDDHSIVRQGIAQILQNTEGIRVVGEAGDGLSGIEMVRRLQPDVVIMDASMPVMNGDEATRIIMSEFPNTRVIALSMHARDEMAETMLAAGAAEYLTKGGPSRDLVDAIRKLGAREGGK